MVRGQAAFAKRQGMAGCVCKRGPGRRCSLAAEQRVSCRRAPLQSAAVAVHGAAGSVPQTRFWGWRGCRCGAQQSSRRAVNPEWPRLRLVPRGPDSHPTLDGVTASRRDAAPHADVAPGPSLTWHPPAGGPGSRGALEAGGRAGQAAGPAGHVVRHVGARLRGAGAGRAT
jgi:hypothetical protein